MSGPTRVAAFAAVVVVALTLSLIFPSGAVTRGSSDRESTPALADGATVRSMTTGSAPATGVTTAVNGSPHPGQIIYDDVAPGGATSEDPSVAYDTVSQEPILNVYQTLVAYEGNNTSSFLPELSLCIPGPRCAAMYGGNTLIVNNGTSPEYWTFPIDPTAKYYDPSTGANWSVYPSDIMFSIARTCAFADLPGFGAQPGWIQCQALLPNGSGAWDSAIHNPYNNTPQNVLGSMLINNTTYCPTSVMMNSNGCITFNARGGDTAWPFFLELVADPLGASAEPCGWFTAQGAGVPGFSGASAVSGDGPCYLPGPVGSHITNTSDPTFQTWLKGLSPTYWDSFEELALNTPGIQTGVRWNMVGSGPYYLANQPFQQSVGYTLLQNPAYAAPTGCAGQPNCEPMPGPTHYQSKVTVVYTDTDAVGIQGYQNGTVDFATILPGETPRMLYLVNESKIGAVTVPTLTIFLLAFALTFDLAAAKSADPYNITIPGDFFSYVGLRQFLAKAFPYNTTENTIFTTDGIQYGFNYGGAIPQYMGNYYPKNISWPTGDPVSNPATVGTAAWWWAQATTASSPYYDPELANCTTSNPCQFPIIGQKGATTVDQMIQDYMPYISSISGGRLAPDTFDYTFCGLNGCVMTSMYNLGWAPDYPDPTDYMNPFYYPNSTYTSSTGGTELYQTLAPLTCSQGPTPTSSQGLVYWADQAGVPQACQGIAYAAMMWGMDQAAGMAVGPARVLMYNLVEHIANDLALYVYYDQQSVTATYASWIDPSPVNTNPVIGGGSDFLWYDVQYGPTAYSVAFTEAGLSSGTNWTVTLNGTMRGSATSTIRFTMPNGQYPFSVGSVAGYTVDQGSGTVTVNGGPVNETISFSSNPAPSSSSGPAWDAVAAYGVVVVGIEIAVVLTWRMRRAPPAP